MKAIARRPRVWEAEVPTTGYAEGELKDWPPSMQDAVYTAMEEIITKTKVKGLDIIQAICYEESGAYRCRIRVMEHLGPEDVRIIH